MSIRKNIALVIISPKIGWEEINQSGISSQKLLSSAFYPLLALLAISSFVPMIYDSTLPLSTCLMNGVIAFFSYFVTHYLCNYLLAGFFPDLNETKAAAYRLDIFVIYNLIFLVILNIFANLLPTQFTPLYFMMLYTSFMIFKGAQFLGVKQENITKFVIIASILIILPPIIFKYVLGLMI
ncbi:MAG: hypothetical protein IK092_05715 [Muribaculaceae bacterium]|nr:hypothetical protein [Muribaculaceae bacterium]